MKYFFLGGGGGGRGWGGAGVAARVSEFFFTKNPNLKKKKSFWLGGWGEMVVGVEVGGWGGGRLE